MGEGDVGTFQGPADPPRAQRRAPKKKKKNKNKNKNKNKKKKRKRKKKKNNVL